MGPGGWANWGSPSVQYMGGQVGLFEEPLSKETKAVLFAATTLVAGPYAILRGGAGLTAALWRARLIIAAGMGFGISSSPGGGGPGQSPTSTNPPPSVEEVGDLLNEVAPSLIYAPRGVPYRTRRKNGKRCPSGYRWDKKRRKCVRIRKY